MLSDVGSERAVLAGVCQFGRKSFLDVSDVVECGTFTVAGNQAIYKCLEKACGEVEKIDIPTILKSATELGLYEIVGKNKNDLEYLRSLYTFPIQQDNVRFFAKKIAKLEFARSAQAKHKEAYDNLSKLKGDETIDEIVDISEKPIFSMVLEMNRGKNDSPILLGDMVDEVIQNKIDSPCENIGIPTPWKHYNAAIGGGLRRGGINLIGARPKRGKSSLTKEMAIHASQTLGVKTLILDTEMNPEDQIMRSLAGLSRVTINKIETGKFAKSTVEKNKVLAAGQKLSNNKFLYYMSIAGKPFSEVMSIIRRWIVGEVGYGDDGNTNPCLVIYDYFKLMNQSDLGKLKEYEALGYQISDFTNFSKEYQFACLAFVQLNREEDISQSDRLRWLCHSYSSFLDKTPEQLMEDGIENGNRALSIMDARYGGGLDVGKYINFRIEGDISIVTEIGIKGTNVQKSAATFEVNEEL